MIDRIGPTVRPDGRNDGTQRWESLLFCHWQVDPASLERHVPDSLQIDTYQGKTYVGIVPFKMRQVRPRWLPRSLAFDFYETNVRIYVVHNDRPGVFFLSLDASSRLAVWAARIGWSLPYHYAKMSSSDQPRLIRYQSQRRTGNARHDVSFRVTDELGPATAGSLEHFLLERYLLFTQRNHTLHAGQVHHQPYHAHLAVVEALSDSLATASGLSSCDRPPDLAHYCPGVDVEVFGIRPV